MAARSLLILFSLFLIAPVAHADGEFPHLQQAGHAAHDLDHHEVEISGAFTSLWDSHYYSEGRDLLDGGDLLQNSVEIFYSDLLFYLWQGHSTEVDYDEFNVGVEYGASAFGFDFFVGYTNLQIDDGGDDFADNEVSAGVSREVGFGVTAGVGAVYSFDADGFYLEGVLEREFEISDRLAVVPSVLLGDNEGYVVQGHRGSDHVSFHLDAVYQITDQVSLLAHVAYSAALNAEAERFEEDALLKDFFYGGVGLSISF